MSPPGPSGTTDPGRPESDPSRAVLSPWERPDPPAAFGAEETARRIGHYKWVEMRLFEALGAWSGTVPELDVKIHLMAHSQKHAWHSELWHRRLPELAFPDLDPDRLTAPANEAMEEFARALTSPDRAETTLERLVGVYRVLIPHKVAAYTFHLSHCSAVSDAPTIRSLRLVLADETEDWREGEMLIQSLIGGVADVRRAADRQAELEAILVRAGGIAGPGSIGPPPATPAR